MIGRIRTQTTEASKAMVDWMEHRTGIVTITEHFLFEPVPKRGAWLYSLGSAVLFTITLQFLTGILLLFYYVPTTDHACGPHSTPTPAATPNRHTPNTAG